MPISFYKSKLLIISSIIITPLYSYSEYKIEKLTPSNHIDFNFNEYTRENIINFPSNEHRHGEMSFRTIPKVFSSKYKNVIIIYEENNIKISYNSGKDFHQFNIEEINYPVILSLSNDGRHAIGSGHKNGRNVFFIYDTYLKTSEILTPIDQDYYFTTQEGRYSLYSKDKEKESNDETQINKKEFFIYDNIKKITIPLNDIDNSELKNHKEKESFLIYSDLTLPQNTILKSPKILGSTLDNQYFYGLSTRKPEDTNKQNLYLDNIKVAFIYDPQNKKINFISNSEYGSSRINAISQNNIAVGWFEERKKFYHDERLFRRAYYYDIKKGTLSTLNYISDWNKYNHSEATDISANGELIVGWVSDKHESNLHTGSTTKRQAFVYQRNNKNAIFLTSLEKDKGSSEAYSISQDGHAILGVSEDNNNQWHTVVWYLDKESNKVDQEKEKVDIFLNTILAKKDIKHAQDHLKEVEKKLSVVSANYNQSLSTLNNQLQEVTKKLNEAIENQDRIEKIIDDGDRDGDSEVWYKYSPLHQQYKDDVDNYETQKADLQQKISSLDNSPIGQELQVYRYEYQKNQQILTELQDDATVAEDKTTVQADKPIADNNVQELPPQPTITVNTPINVRNTEQAIQLAAENGYKLIDMQQGQLRYLASATCSVGMEKACLSGFTHYQDIDKANAIQTGISGAYRFDINQTPLVVGLAIDSDSYSSLPKGYEYQGYPLPLIGFSVDVIPSLNPTSNSNALHLSLKGAYVNRKITIERPTLSNTEAGKGQARISGYYIDLQGYYPYALNSLITVTPFAGLTFNQTSRSAYSETQGAKFAAHYQALTAHSLLTKIGLGIEYAANAKLKLDTKAGLLWQLSHHQDDFQSHIDYIGQQKINYNENKKQLAQRPFASVGLTYQLDKQSSVNTTTNWQMTSYRNHDIHMGIAYTYRF